ncbi:hypothetical protein JTE90_002158 [Oedothorax gibbosus]|uniref:Uncharacterized protein n=1 Tax=Oedothorax gibbosus TaxID=931172 RepID=A0AAV6V8C2_9ARAC|nr:hypothetical protein JTE90_002158 [Oedothorax gibbosus]
MYNPTLSLSIDASRSALQFETSSPERCTLYFTCPSPTYHGQTGTHFARTRLFPPPKASLDTYRRAFENVEFEGVMVSLE